MAPDSNQKYSLWLKLRQQFYKRQAYVFRERLSQLNFVIWECLKFADVALYQAKDRSRSRVIRFDPELWDNH